MRLKFALSLLAVLIAAASNTMPAFARGGGAANLLNSPGYQRAQKEARDRYLQAYSAAHPQATPSQPRRKPRHGQGH